jgi:heat shock protein HslJ
MEFPSGKYQVVTLNHENYKPAKEYILNVSAEKNSINGTFDCNTFNVDFERNGNEVKFGYGMATKMYCEGNMHNESSFFKSTQDITTYTYKEESLIFYNAVKEVVLELKFIESE